MNEFYKKIKIDVKGYNGKYSHIISITPELYKLICDLFTHANLKSPLKTELLAVIGYYVIPEDILNEDILGPIGYIDDFLLSASLLRKIELLYDIETIEEYWENEIDIKTIIYNYFDEAKADYMYEYSKIKELVPALFTYKH